MGHDYLEDIWDQDTPDELDEPLGAVLMGCSPSFRRGSWRRPTIEKAECTGALNSWLKPWPRCFLRRCSNTLASAAPSIKRGAVPRIRRRSCLQGRLAKCCGKNKGVGMSWPGFDGPFNGDRIPAEVSDGRAQAVYPRVQARSRAVVGEMGVAQPQRSPASFGLLAISSTSGRPTSRAWGRSLSGVRRPQRADGEGKNRDILVFCVTRRSKPAEFILV